MKLNQTVMGFDPQQANEWIEALNQVVETSGPEGAVRLLDQLSERARILGADLPIHLNTPYANTIRSEDEIPYPGDRLERRIKSLIRWNAMAMVVRRTRTTRHRRAHLHVRFAGDASKSDSTISSRLGTAISRATSSISRATHRPACMPALSSKAAERGAPEQLPSRIARRPGLSSYPHPWLMPDFWQFPDRIDGPRADQRDLSGALHALPGESRHHPDDADRKVWAFLGDGETDEPETLGAMTLASREKLDNLIFVVNCNLQRLDGPVRGNGKHHPGTGSGVPRRRLERDQGHVGRGLGRAVRARYQPACC